MLITLLVSCNTSPESSGGGSGAELASQPKPVDTTESESGSDEVPRADAAKSQTLEGTHVILDPQEAEELESTSTAVSLCSLLDSVSVEEQEVKESESTTRLKVHLGDAGTLDFEADSMMAVIHGWPRHPDFADFNRRIFYGKGCGILDLSWEIEMIPSFLSVFGTQDDAFVLLRQKENEWTRSDSTGRPLWAAKIENVLSKTHLIRARDNANPEPAGPRLKVVDREGRLTQPSGDTLFVDLGVLEPHAEWSHAPEQLHADIRGETYNRLLSYSCLSGNGSRCMSKEELGLSDAYRIADYIPYRVMGSEVVTPDTVVAMSRK